MKPQIAQIQTASLEPQTLLSSLFGLTKRMIRIIARLEMSLAQHCVALDGLH
jgi:hypothetical protein